MTAKRPEKLPAKQGRRKQPDVVADGGPIGEVQGYGALVADLKERITNARLRAALSVNRELVVLYWGIGRDILARQNSEGWGAKVIDRLAADLGLSAVVEFSPKVGVRNSPLHCAGGSSWS